MQAKSKFTILVTEATENLRSLFGKIDAGYVINTEEINDVRVLLLCSHIIRDRSIVNLLRDGKTPEDIKEAFGVFAPEPELIARLQEFVKLKDQENT